MPDGNPKFEKLPRPESIDAFIKYVKKSKVVLDVTQENQHHILIQKNNGSSLKIHMTNIYIVGLADVAEILADEEDIEAIITLSAWNGYSSEAKKYCKKNNVGLFKFKEFLGAIYYNGRQFLNYIHPDDKRR